MFVSFKWHKLMISGIGYKNILALLFFLTVLVSTVDAAVKKNPKGREIDNSQEAEQKMMDFSLAGYTQNGKKSWEVKGNSADIFSDIVRLTEVNADVYGEEENINLVGDKGAYDKTNGKMHLEDNVVITTASGGKLTTDSLDWDRASQKVTTEDIVNIQKQNIKTTAKGLEGEPNLRKVYLKEDVQVEIEEESGGQTLAQPNLEQPNKQPTVITCQGPLEIDYAQQIATFNNNVKVNQQEQGDMFSDKMEVYFDFKQKKILRAKAMGNVKIVKGENISYSEEAIYSASDKKMTLTGSPRLVIYSEDKIVNASP